MKKFLKENKLMSGILGFLFTSIITYNILWSTWVTNQIFCHKEIMTSHAAIRIVEEKATSKQIEEVKSDIKDFKKDIKDELGKVKDKMDSNHEKIMDILIKMNKNQNKMIEKDDKSK